jgi:hypothetical protein
MGHSSAIPLSWAVEGLNNLHRNISCCLFRFLTRNFASFFQKRFRIPKGTLESVKVYASLMVGVLTIFFLLLRLICGVCR